ncbi:MAG TPA: sulfite exporter TauE/SafE family protein [Candidatus Acidoferrales bacterium]|nr:sulfite exporter TauE/SafE family protein [Candidatus Acidoferrales bacterium]
MHLTSVLALTCVVGAGSFVAGLIGALTGLGGGVVLIPMLTLALGIDIRYAIGASLVSVIATSSGAAAAYVREGYTNIRVAMFLEIATSCGAIFGAYLAGWIQTRWIGVVFGVVLLHSALTSLRKHQAGPRSAAPHSSLATALRLEGSYPAEHGMESYRAAGIPAGFGLMGLAGILSGLLGIGSGAVKVMALDRAMKLPFKVSTTTSNFMIGVTAAASAGIYLGRGYVDPGLAMPVTLGVLAGALTGARLLATAPVPKLRLLFAIVIGALAVEMIFNSLTGRI